MHHLNETQLAQLKMLLNSELIKIRSTINTIFLQSSHASHHLAVKNLARLSVDQLIEFTAQVENSELKKNVEKLKKLDASLISVEHGMYGLCSDCESELSFSQLRENPTMQRCPACEQKYQKQSCNKYRL